MTKMLLTLRITTLFWMLSAQLALAEWHLSVTFLNFTAPTDNDIINQPCDVSSLCDVIFRLCRGQSVDITTCTDSRPFNNAASIQFGREGPTLFPPQLIETLPTNYIVDVSLLNVAGRVIIDFLQITIHQSQLTPGAIIPVLFQGGGFRLTLQLVVQCNPPSVGPRCQCRPYDNVLCNVTTGQQYCLSGFSGTDCKNPTSPVICERHTCDNGATCQEKEGSVVCSCLRGFTGSRCETNIDDCVAVTCQNGGACFDEINGFSCACKEGFFGPLCQNAIDWVEVSCYNGGTMVTRTGGQRACECPTGYSGTHCEKEVNQCASQPCHHSGRCIATASGFVCLCPFGYSGTRCELDQTNHCDGIQCANGGSCHYVIGATYCLCARGFKGDHCEVEIDECNSSPCLNGGTCVDGINKYTCTCPPGLSGAYCQFGPTGEVIIG